MEKLKLNNYRCFENLELHFEEKVNLLIGDNASGKTTVMKAITSVLNSFFIGFNDENTRFFGLAKDDFTIFNTETGLANDKPIIIDFTLSEIEGSLQLNSKKGRTLQKPLDFIIKWSNRFQEQLFNDNKKQVTALPLFAAFSTNDIHSTRKLSAEKFKQYAHKPSFGYYECLQGDGFLDYWTKRLLVLQEGQKNMNEIGVVIAAVLAALGKNGCNIITDMQVRHNQGKVHYILSDGREVETEMLSDGYRRLVNIVVDIAFRCAILNIGIHGIDSCCKTKGTVLIDEIDLHLHPTLQSTVLKGLCNAFPKLQFIITSHAPMVMTGVPMDNKNKIIKLSFNESNGYAAKDIETYGLDASTIIQAVLGVTPRYQEVEDRLKTLFALIDNDQYEKASISLTNMREQFGNNLPELAKAEAMLNFLTEEPDDSNK